MPRVIETILTILTAGRFDSVAIIHPVTMMRESSAGIARVLSER